MTVGSRRTCSIMTVNEHRKMNETGYVVFIELVVLIVIEYI
jgi:hypothetical protein